MEKMTTEILITDKAIIKINRPVLTDEERARRMKAIEKAAVNLARAIIRAEAQKKQREQAQSA